MFDPIGPGRSNRCQDTVESTENRFGIGPVCVIMQQTTDIKVFISARDSTCDECSENLGSKAWITLDKGKGALCLACADLDHLVFLPSGNAADQTSSQKLYFISGRFELEPE